MLTLIAALKSELLPFLRHWPPSDKTVLSSGTLYRTKNIHMLRCGLGQKSAEIVLKTYLKNHTPQIVINVGFAGCLLAQDCSDYTRAVQTVVDAASGRHYTLQLPPNLPAEKVTRVLTVPDAITEARHRDRLYQKFGMELVDMELAAIASVCAESNLPLYSFKLVSDQANEDTKSEFMANYKRLAEKLAGETVPVIQNLLAKLEYSNEQ